jgi:GT2 family glycosyltransferase
VLARADALAAEAKISELEGRVAALEADARLRYAENLELMGSLVPSAPPRDRTVVLSEDARIVHDLFAGIAERKAGQPSLVTIIIPVFGKIDYTLRCLRSIAGTWSESINANVIVVDDGSPDSSVHELIGIPGVTVLRNGTNAGYLRSTNRGAALADTRYLCFLNNDTEVRNGWLDALVSTAEDDEAIGAVGSKLLYPDGTLQEAGGIIWSDATGWNYGRGDDPNKPEYNIARDVDYCSAASLLVRTDIFRSIGGLDERYAPAYYEDADLCFAIRNLGFRVVYEPRSELVHYEGVSSGTDVSSGIKRYQELNRPKFAEKWQQALTRHLPPDAANVERAVTRKLAKAILVIDSYVPLHDREAGSNRLFKIIQILRDLRYDVLFFPDNGAPIEPYSGDLRRLGVDILYCPPDGTKQQEMLAAFLRRVEVAWICRPELAEKYLPAIREASAGIPIIYDTIDLHFTREKKRFELEGGDAKLWQRLQTVELGMARAANLVVTVTDVERKILADYDIDAVAVIPTVHDVEEHEDISFASRTGLLFIGGYAHTPNVDAAEWLCKDVMPLVWQAEPEITVTLVGSNPTPAVLALRSDRVRVTGFVAQIKPLFEEARLFVAPLRYGAGMKGKIGQALSFGLPFVTTTVGVDGYPLEDGKNCLIADDARSFAEAIVKLYRDPEMWERFRDEGAATIADLGRDAVRGRLEALLFSLGVSTGL